MSGFENVKIETLIKIRGNLLKGLDKVADSLKDGTYKKIGPKGEASPSESGNLTLSLLKNVEAELKSRK
jgi:hypothetical protein